MNINKTHAIIKRFFNDVVNQNAEQLKEYFAANAVVRWHNSNEQFTASDYIIANCEYPNDWAGEVKQINFLENNHDVVVVARIWAKDLSVSLHVTSFIKFENDKIIALDEYFSDDGDAPKWRADMHLSTPIKDK